MLNWANQFGIFSFMDNNGYGFDAPAFECLLAAGCKQLLTVNNKSDFENLAVFSKNNSDWLFGHLGYDLKNYMEQLSSANFDGIGFADACFFIPETVVQLSASGLTIFSENDAHKIFEAISSQSDKIESEHFDAVTLKSRFSKTDYISTVNKIKQHILKGDCYEINFCQEFFSEKALLNLLQVFAKLNAVSPAPFSVLYKMNETYCVCASPERYLKKTGDKIISQPIKGTSKRDLKNLVQDEANKKYLLESEKEKSENVMVVDLVRNDLSKVCKKGSVRVDELFGIYSFPQVHQMISTVSGVLDKEMNWVDIIKASFPMGSMTGAPKKRVMELIEQYELTKRGLFSGAIGYIMPDGNFDFNVVIRSIFYNSSSRYVSIQAGSAITFNSDAELEYEECLLKIAALKQALS